MAQKNGKKINHIFTSGTLSGTFPIHDRETIEQSHFAFVLRSKCKCIAIFIYLRVFFLYNKMPLMLLLLLLLLFLSNKRQHAHSEAYKQGATTSPLFPCRSFGHDSNLFSNHNNNNCLKKSLAVKHRNCSAILHVCLVSLHFVEFALINNKAIC